MRTKICLTVIMIGLLALGLTGCVDVAQTVEINPDSSGKLSFDISVSETLDAVGAEQVKTILALLDTLSNLDIPDTALDNTFTRDEYVKAGNKHYVYQLETNNLQAFLAALQPSLSKAGVTMQIDKLDNRNLLFKQTIGMAKSDTLPLPKELLGSALKGYNWTLLVKVRDVVQTNGQYDQAAQTVTWTMPIADVYAQQAIVMTVEYKQPFNWTLIYILGGALAALLAAVIVVMILRKKKKASLEPSLEDDLATPLEF